jgi:hypothetical protein
LVFSFAGKNAAATFFSFQSPASPACVASRLPQSINEFHRYKALKRFRSEATFFSFQSPASPACAASRLPQEHKRIPQVQSCQAVSERSDNKKEACRKAGLKSQGVEETCLVVVVVQDGDDRVRTGVEEHQSAYANGGSRCRRCFQRCAIRESHWNGSCAAQRSKS